MGKSIQDISIRNNELRVTYFDDLGKTVVAPLSDLTKLPELISEVQAKLDAMPKAEAMVDVVKYVNESFAITGEHYFPCLKTYSDLLPEHKTIVDNLKTKVLEVTGEVLSSLETKYGTNKLTINGVEYDYAQFESPEFVQAIGLSIYLFNNQ